MRRIGLRSGIARLFALAVFAALAGCGGSGGDDGARTPAASATPSSEAVVRELTPPAQRCGPPDAPAELVRLRTADRVMLDGAVVGDGPAGAVLLHMSPSDLCDWWPFARDLARRGIHAMMIDLRCNGDSGCPTDVDEFTDPAADVAAAAAELRRRGARRVTIVGASLGGASALIAGARLGDESDGVASLSGEPRFESGLDVPAVIGRLRAPLLLAVAPGDQYVSVAETRAMLRRAGSRRKALLVRPPGAGHGIELLLTRDRSRPGPLFDALVRFIRDGRLPDLKP